MSVIYHLLSVGPIRKVIWKYWYPFVTRRLANEGVVFLNYGYEEEPPMKIDLRPEDEADRACIQLYHHVGSQVSLKGKDVLEVSCGHGGGAAYLTRTFQPRQYTGVDLNPAAVQLCRERHRIEQLVFERGDCEALPAKENSLDAMINVEASHCYPVFARFLSEAARVLRPGGHLLYADFRFRERLAEWEQALASGPLRILRSRIINTEVLRGINRNTARSMELISRHLPRMMQSLGRDFAGMKGSRIYDALSSGELSYRSYCLEKPR